MKFVQLFPLGLHCSIHNDTEVTQMAFEPKEGKSATKKAARKNIGREPAELAEQEICSEVRIEKYAKGVESSKEDIFIRVARALAENEAPETRDRWERAFYQTLLDGFIPAGRIMSAAGTNLQATLINCFVQGVGDSVSEDKDGKPGIYRALLQAAETMRRGGGVGYDFSRIRPENALVKGTASKASGPVSYMRVFDRSCETVESAGSRRGAQMGVLACDHPDIEKFIHAKDDGDLKNFNLSVGVSDSFMSAVESDGMVELWHRAEPAEELKDAGAYKRDDGMWVYRKAKARDVWSQIMHSTYDHAEPGILFLDRINRDNNLSYCEIIEATNPCVTSDTWVFTGDGPRRVADLVGVAHTLVVDGKTHQSSYEGFFSTGKKHVFELLTEEGFSMRLTKDHPIQKAVVTRDSIRKEWVNAEHLVAGESIVIHNHRVFDKWTGTGTSKQGYLLGLLFGDGTIGKKSAVLSVWGLNTSSSIKNEVIKSSSCLRLRSDHKGWRDIPKRDESRFTSSHLKSLAAEFGIHEEKTLTPEIETSSSDFYKGFLRGFFDADGSVQGNFKKGVSIRLSQSNKDSLAVIQRMLARLGVISSIYYNRRHKGETTLPDGRGGTREYKTKAQHELFISRDNIVQFFNVVGFSDEGKMAKLSSFVGGYNRKPNRERFVATVKSLVHVGEEEVFDVSVPGVNAFDANGIYAHNCGEQALPDYGCCCLGSVDLTRFVSKPFTVQASFDFDAFAKVVGVAVRMLDNVLDVTKWPLDEQFQEAQAKRRIGLGFTGLGDALIMLRLKYDSPEALAMAELISEALRDASYSASSDLAAEKGPFKVFDADLYLEEPRFASRLPEWLKDKIREQGMRNSHLMSIAPTGTISLAFAQNASNGIEPPFSWGYVRKKRQADGSKKEYSVEDHAFRLWHEMNGTGNLPFDEKIKIRLPDYFRSALEIKAIDHAMMSASVTKYIDACISKTVNVPEDYPYADFQNLYIQAWKAGLKGITTYRPNAVLGSVLSMHSSAPDAAKVEDFQNDANRRIHIKKLPEPVLGSLRWPDRPNFPSGNSSWTYMVDHPEGDFALFVGEAFESEVHDRGESGKTIPFEVWIQGRKAPRALGAVAKVLSIDMRSADKGWVAKKLSALAKTQGETPFLINMPPSGEKLWMLSACQAIAKVISWRCDSLGTFEDNDPEPGDQKSWLSRTPLMDSLFSEKEPKTGPGGTLGWCADILNPQTGDDFVLGLKEITLPDGSHRPYSMWLSGVYPKALDGLCKLLSIDMRVVDPAWIGLKLRKLINYSEPLGEFMAKVPGSAEGKMTLWPSTVAYVAALVLHRYHQLGILDMDGKPVLSMGIMAAPEEKPDTPPSFALARPTGKICKECGNPNVIKKDGCEFCEACGAIGACG